jgi:hypothetical protein
VTASHRGTRRWTRLGHRLGLTNTAAARARFTAEAAALSWSRVPPVPDWLARPPLAPLAVALFGRDLARVRAAGAAPLPDGRLLIGLADTTGMRWCLLRQPTPGARGWITEVVVLFTNRPAAVPGVAA